MIKRQRISITGRVQGVGFRPAVYRIARSLGLSGIVYNDTKGVTVELQGKKGQITDFLARLRSSDKPPLAEIKSCKTVDIDVIEAEDKFIIATSNSQGTPLSQIIAEAAGLLLAGKIVAIKGIGGFHLAADALNEEAVTRLRERKKRDHKPFAMMTDSVKRIKEHAIVSGLAEQVLRNPQSPIVLLPKKENSPIAPSVAEGVDTYAFMLCYAPLHYLLFEQCLQVMVMTSGNISDEPLICRNEPALERLGCVADAFLMHDREIHRQVDDSVLHFIDEQPALLRRARGYVPAPIFMEKTCREDIFAAGADLKNTFCFAKQNQLICCEHIGDLEDAEVYHHYIDSIEHFRRLFEVEPKVVVCDLHPAYLSTRYALLIPDVRVVQVQHHWAHIASVLVEHGLEGPVIGLVADGTGYGTDGAIWGCECMIASLERFERFGHLSYYSLPGADKASKEAVRPVLSLLKEAYGSGFTSQKLDWLFKQIEPDAGRLQTISEQLEKGVNCIETSSLGRVFDAVAAMLGLGNYNHFDAQLPMALETAAAADIEEHYDFELMSTVKKPVQLDLCKMLKQVIADLQKDQAVGIISAKFHNTLAAALLEMARAARESTNFNTVALSGGVFCNRYLTNRLIKQLKQNGFSVLFNRDVPSNDGGISVGQAAIAAKLVAAENGQRGTNYVFGNTCKDS